METILITGMSGLLGRYLWLTKPDKYKVYGTYKTNLPTVIEHDCVRMGLSDPLSVRDVMRAVKPDVVIHCAGNGSVDDHEFDRGVYLSSLEGNYNLIDEVALAGAKLVLLSSNAVYKGDNPPYSEDDPHDPVNMYGHMKSSVEWYAKRAIPGVLIIRPILMYGWPWPGGRGNWAYNVVTRLRKGQAMNVVNDTFTQPLYAKDCAEIIWSMVVSKIEGSYNVSSGEAMSLYQFACGVAAYFDLDVGLIHPITSDDLTGLAPRPIDTAFDTRTLEMLGFGYTNEVEVGLDYMVDEEALWLSQQ